MSVLTRHVNSPKAFDLELPGRGTLQSKIYVGFVKGATDSDYMGRLLVWIPELCGDPNDSSTWILMNYCTPFAGATNYLNNKNTQNYQDSQTSYGMWFVPPDINNEVVCAFINGDPARGIWFGCLYQQFMNSMVPGLPGQNGTASLPTVEYNKNLTQTDLQNPTRPEFTPLASQLILEGLDQDTVRGVSDSSARRSSPANAAFGILTPGASQFVMDDNPTNTFIRLRTVSGAQLLINDTIGTIYAITPNGMSWLSMDDNGRVDIYGAEDISLRASGSMNLHADIDVNIEAGNNINMKARGDVASTPAAASGPIAPLPSTQPGPIEIIGDDIGAGIASKVNGAANGTTPGANSGTILAAIQGNSSLQNTTNAILAIGTNDDVSTSAGQAALAANLASIKNYVQATNYIWVLPYEAVRKGIVSNAAGIGTTIDLSNYPTNDNIHPRSYELVANDIQQKCTPATTSSTAPTGPATPAVAGTGSTGTSGPTGPSQIVDTPAQPSGGTTGPVAPAATPSTSAVTTSQSYQTIAANFLIPYEGHAKGGYGSYPDPSKPTSPTVVTTGYGHVITSTEYSQQFINCGSAGQCPCTYQANPSNFSQACPTMTQAQALGLLTSIDVPKYAQIAIGIVGSGSWQLCNPYQQAALTSVAFNSPVGLKRLVAEGLTTFIAKNDIPSGANLLANRPSANNSAGLTKRKQAEANLYSQSSGSGGGNVSAGSGSLSSSGTAQGSTVGPIVVDGEQLPGTGTATQAQGGFVPSNPSLTGGYVRIQSRNDMHILSQENMFLTTALEMHRYVGTNLYDTSANNANRLVGGYLHESVNADIGIFAGNNIIIISPRVDINGPPITPALAASEAQGPTDFQQSDATIDSVGNVILQLTETICTNLPFHEPYDNHGGPPLPSIKNSTALNTTLFATLRDGEVIANSSAPLSVYGTPLTGMPSGSYVGVSYNSQSQPVYNLTASLANIIAGPASTMQVDAYGQQFIQSRENGIFTVASLGSPPVKTIGYGHDLTPIEISSNSIDIGGSSVSLATPLTQPQVVTLFNQDLNAVVTWMQPILGNVAVTQTQFDMLASLAFDIGQTNFTSSPAIMALIAGNYQKIPNNWMQHSADASGNPIQAYVIKRRAEVTQFATAPSNAISQAASGNIGVQNPNGTVNVVPNPSS